VLKQLALDGFPARAREFKPGSSRGSSLPIASSPESLPPRLSRRKRPGISGNLRAAGGGAGEWGREAEREILGEDKPRKWHGRFSHPGTGSNAREGRSVRIIRRSARTHAGSDARVVNQTCHYRSALRASDDIYRLMPSAAHKEAEINRGCTNKRFSNPGYA